MTIGEIIIRNELAAAKARLSKLEALGAPAVTLEAIRREVAQLEAGELKIGGDRALLELEAEGAEVKTGRGGKKYIRFANGVQYFPQARYGRFISREK